jgi:2-polyprenyl-6-methoxyphenol hydroxylase-like FAD-dependent oxidoreductase
VVAVTDVLVVGAGPTGLAVAAVARAHGASVRVVDRAPTAAHESRALVLQPRTLEVLTGLGVAAELLRRGQRTVRLTLHSGARAAQVPLFDVGISDTPYPFLLFVSQAETEAVLAAHLAEHGVPVERGTELVGLEQRPDRVVGHLVRGGTARTVEQAEAAYAVGCDGGGSTVRRLLGVGFRGGRYPQRFALADVSVDGDLPPGQVHSYLGRRGMLFLFPLGSPAPWRVLGLLPEARPDTEPDPGPDGELTLAAVQAVTDEFTGGRLRLRDPVWLSDFRLRHRLADRYRVGRVFLAGDAAHVHSPAGGQGMNVGIQDAANLGWKLALVAAGRADPALLDSYEPERRPVGRALLAFTDRLFTIATSTAPPVAVARTVVAPRLLPLLARVRPLRAAGFRRVAELDVAYRRSPAVARTGPVRRPAPGDRLPDAAAGDTTLHELVGTPGFHLLLAGPVPGVDHPAVPVSRLHPTDPAWRRLHIRDAAQLLVRPDGHLAYRADTADPAGLRAYLDRWLPTVRTSGAA